MRCGFEAKHLIYLTATGREKDLSMCVLRCKNASHTYQYTIIAWQQYSGEGVPGICSFHHAFAGLGGADACFLLWRQLINVSNNSNSRVRDARSILVLSRLLYTRARHPTEAGGTFFPRHQRCTKADTIRTRDALPSLANYKFINICCPHRRRRAHNGRVKQPAMLTRENPSVL